jgi:hypothetical protein
MSINIEELPTLSQKVIEIFQVEEGVIKNTNYIDEIKEELKFHFSEEKQDQLINHLVYYLTTYIEPDERLSNCYIDNKCSWQTHCIYNLDTEEWASLGSASINWSALAGLKIAVDDINKLFVTLLMYCWFDPHFVEVCGLSMDESWERLEHMYEETEIVEVFDSNAGYYCNYCKETIYNRGRHCIYCDDYDLCETCYNYNYTFYFKENEDLHSSSHKTIPLTLTNPNDGPEIEGS